MVIIVFLTSFGLVWCILIKFNRNEKQINNLTEQIENLKPDFNLSNIKYEIDKQVTDSIVDQLNINDKFLDLLSKKISEEKNLNKPESKVSQSSDTNDSKDTNQKSEPDTFPLDTEFKPYSKREKLPRYSDVIGMEQEKKLLDDFLDYIKHPEAYTKFGVVKPSQGVIFYGCPGTGKTFLSRAFAKEAGDKVGYYELNASIFSCGTMGEGPEKVRHLFRDVRRYNENDNIISSIIFLDECEEIFKDLSKSGENNSKDLANIVNQFKTELTSTENNPNKPILIIAATNYFDKLDEAIKSRLDGHIEIKVSNAEEREIFLKKRIQQRKNPYDDEAKLFLYRINKEIIEKLSDPHKANRRLEQLLNTAVLKAARERENEKIHKSHLYKAFQQVYNNIEPNLNEQLKLIYEELKN